MFKKLGQFLGIFLLWASLVQAPVLAAEPASEPAAAPASATAASDAAVPSVSDKNSNWVPVALVGANKLEGTTLQQLIWFIDKTTLKSSLDDAVRNKNGYEATVMVRTVANLKNGEVSLLNEKWYIHTGGKEEGLFRGITERETIYQGKTEKLRDVAVSKVLTGSQDETVAQMIMLYDTQRAAKK